MRDYLQTAKEFVYEERCSRGCGDYSDPGGVDQPCHYF